ncbi:MAG: bifunctional phosphopantothenoylcysteine decarboxylase/phosphopantothenate synthase [Novosphingobium sp.]
MNGPRILLIVGGGIAAYKACELVRLIRRGGFGVTCVLTEGGSHFVTAMSLAALSENPVHTTLWDLRNEVEMGHIQLSRQADLVVVCPATADLMAKMAAGIADDLATTLLLATDKPVLAVPAMNVRMWQHAATVRNVATLRASGVAVMDPDEGAMACGEYGPGRLPEPDAILSEILNQLEAAVPAAPLLPPLGESEDEAGEFDSYQDDAEASLPGLSGSLISRSTIKFDMPPIDPDMEAMMAAQMGFETFPLEDAPQFAPPPPEVLLSSPLLSRKGKARAAPPTDAEAINHEVDARQVAPEPLQAAPAHEETLAENPLAGQPDFDTTPEHRPLFGKHVLVTAGPTYEAIDPVRFIANRSSGKQGYAIAEAAARLGARVTLVSGPVFLPTPPGVDRVDVESARDMAEAVKQALPADVAIMVAAVADWRTKDFAGEKIKKRGSAPPALLLTENPDILATLAGSPKRPKLLIGFAAETEDVLPNAKEKRKRKGADWIVANDVSGPVGTGVMGGSANTVHIVTAKGVESLPEMPKEEVARALVEKIANAL